MRKEHGSRPSEADGGARARPWGSERGHRPRRVPSFTGRDDVYRRRCPRGTGGGEPGCRPVGSHTGTTPTVAPRICPGASRAAGVAHVLPVRLTVRMRHATAPSPWHRRQQRGDEEDGHTTDFSAAASPAIATATTGGTRRGRHSGCDAGVHKKELAAHRLGFLAPPRPLGGGLLVVQTGNVVATVILGAARLVGGRGGL